VADQGDHQPSKKGLAAFCERRGALIGVSITLLIFLSPFILRSTLSYSGRCGWSVLSEKELIRLAAEQLNERKYLYLPNVEQRFERQPYKDVDDFFNSNNGCCKLGTDKFGNGFPITFVDRIQGKAAYEFTAEYKVRYLADDKKEKVVVLYEYNHLGNCGKLRYHAFDKLVSSGGVE